MVYLKPALAVILVFIGAKMFLAEVYHIPTVVSLGLIALVLSIAVGLSLFSNRSSNPMPLNARRTERYSTIKSR
jgi:predicted tellurium resistance membrane protein TerC